MDIIQHFAFRKDWTYAEISGRSFLMPTEQFTELQTWWRVWQNARHAFNHAQRREAFARTDRGALPRR